MSGSVPGYPTPAQDEGIHELRDDPDAENPNLLVLGADEFPEPLPPLPRAAQVGHRRRT